MILIILFLLPIQVCLVMEYAEGGSLYSRKYIYVHVSRLLTYLTLFVHVRT